MRISSQAIPHAGATSPAGAGPQGAGDIDALFASLLAAAIPADAAPVSLPLTLANTALTAPGDGSAEATSAAADHELNAAADPSILALLPDTRAAAAAAIPSSADADAPNEALRSNRTSTMLLPPLAAGSRDAPPVSAAETTLHRASAEPSVATASSTTAARIPAGPEPIPQSPARGAERAATPAADMPGFALPLASNNSPAPANAATNAAALHVPPPVSSDRWGQALGQQVLWMAQKDVQSASLTLNPPELGPVKIELQLNDAQAVASFSSALPEVRKAIEAALPELKTMFADAGLDLRQADVGSGHADSPAHRNARDGHADDARGRQSSAPASASEPLALPGSRESSLSRGLLDTFA